MDVYLLTNDSGYFFPTPTIGSHTLADNQLGNIFKLLDPEAGCLVLMGEKYFYNPIRAEVLRIFKGAIAADRNGGRLDRVQNDL